MRIRFPRLYVVLRNALRLMQLRGAARRTHAGIPLYAWLNGNAPFAKIIRHRPSLLRERGNDLARLFVHSIYRFEKRNNKIVLKFFFPILKLSNLAFVN